MNLELRIEHTREPRLLPGEVCIVNVSEGDSPIAWFLPQWPADVDDESWLVNVPIGDQIEVRILSDGVVRESKRLTP